MVGIDGVGNSAVLSKAIQDGGPASAPSFPSPSKTNQGAAKGNAVQTQDQVVLSDQSKELSQRLQQMRANERLASAENNPVQDKAPEKNSLSSVEIVKYFPPFLNNVRRQEILQQHPELREQIDKMTIPPPVDYLAESQKPPSANKDKPVSGS